MKKTFLTLLTMVMLTLVVSCTKKNPVVTLVTAQGEIKVELFVEKAPVTATHFLKLVKEGIYDGGSFYRVVRSNNDNNPVYISVLQGGVRDKQGLPDIEPITHETTKDTGVRHLEGTISMARSKPGTARTEFFICLRDEPELNYGGLRNPDGEGFAAFGQVIDGLDVVLKIYQGRASGQNLDPVAIIHSASAK